MAVRLGIDIGGTFTDLQVSDGRTGRSGSVKTPTTPENPAIGPIEAIDQAAPVRLRPRGCRPAAAWHHDRRQRRDALHDLHRQRFLYASAADPNDVVTLRLAAIGRLDAPEPETGSAATEGFKSRPYGLDGGLPGVPGRLVHIRDGQEAAPPSKIGNLRLRRGDRIRLETSSGAGFGPPGEQPAAEAAADRLAGYVGADEPSDAA